MFEEGDFKEIEIGDKQLFDFYIGKRYHENSEFNFTNFFIWRNHYRLEFTVFQDHLCLIGSHCNNYPIIFPPLGDQKAGFDRALMGQIEYFKKRGFPIRIKGITDPVKELIREALPGVIRFKPDRDMYDYVYLSDDLINLRGRKYQKKRNHINKFRNFYDFEYDLITKDDLEGCLKIHKDQVSVEPGNIGGIEEKIAIIEAFNNMDSLGIIGGALKVANKIQAFALGESLNKDMAVIHIEKANIEFEGSYAMINQQFAEHSWQDYKYINREEDMGITGLRKAKKSYHPVKMIAKYSGHLS